MKPLLNTILDGMLLVTGILCIDINFPGVWVNTGMIAVGLIILALYFYRRPLRPYLQVP